MFTAYLSGGFTTWPFSIVHETITRVQPYKVALNINDNPHTEGASATVDQ